VPWANVLDVAGDFLGSRTLLLHGARDRRGDTGNLDDGAADLLDGRDRFLGRALHAGYVRRYLPGRLRGLVRQRLDLGSDDGETSTGLAGARGFDGCIQRQQIGLPGDRGDQLDDVADLLGGARQFADAAVGLLRLKHRGLRDLVGFAHPPSDFIDRH
jgi:hypothetical protein